MVIYFFCGVTLRFICISVEPQLRRGSSLWNGRDKKVSSSLKVRPKLLGQRNESEEEAQVAKPLLWFCEAIPPFHGSNVMKTFYASWKEGPQKACLSQLENHRYPVLPCVSRTIWSLLADWLWYDRAFAAVCVLGRGRSQQEHRTVGPGSVSDSKLSSSSLGNLPPLLKRSSLWHPPKSSSCWANF